MIDVAFSVCLVVDYFFKPAVGLSRAGEVFQRMWNFYCRSSLKVGIQKIAEHICNCFQIKLVFTFNLC